MNNNGAPFYTVRGYALMRQKGDALTPSMEDYLEMIYRLAEDKGYARITDLAGALHVQSPSASRMVQKLAELEFVHYERYGVIELTEQGRAAGAYLLRRHRIIEAFLRLIGVDKGILEETEKIEHSISAQTLERISMLVEFLTQNRDALPDFDHPRGGRERR